MQIMVKYIEILQGFFVFVKNKQWKWVLTIHNILKIIYKI